MQFSAILVRTSEQTGAAIPPRLSHTLPGFSTMKGCWEEPVIPFHSLDMAMYTIRAYLSPCNHRKACRETKWTIRDRAPPTYSKQISLSIEAPFNSGTSCMGQDGKWATTHDSSLYGQEVHPYFPPGSTLVFDTDCFLTFGAKTTRSTSQFFGTYWWLTNIQT